MECIIKAWFIIINLFKKNFIQTMKYSNKSLFFIKWYLLMIIQGKNKKKLKNAWKIKNYSFQLDIHKSIINELWFKITYQWIYSIFL